MGITNHLALAATDLRVGDVIVHGSSAGNQHVVETVGRESVQGHEFVTYTGSTRDGGTIEFASVNADLVLDVERAA